LDAALRGEWAWKVWACSSGAGRKKGREDEVDGRGGRRGFREVMAGRVEWIVRMTRRRYPE
jgi:hypothetical protein